MHIDLGPARVWGERFPVRSVPFAEETPPAREVLAQSRTLRGTGTAGVATVGAAGFEVAQEVLTEAQGAVLPLVLYFDTLRWVFIVLALGGIAVTIYARLDDWKRGCLKGTGAAGVATVGAAGVEIAQGALAEAQGAVLPLASYLDTLRWMFIALALGGIVVAVWARVDDWRKGLL